MHPSKDILISTFGYTWQNSLSVSQEPIDRWQQQTEVAKMNQLDLEREIAKVTMGIMTRNRQIALDIIANLSSQMTLEEVAGLLIVSLERLIWFDGELFLWAVESLLPVDITYEIRRIMSVNTYKRLIAKGFIPGEDFSINADGTLLQKPCPRAYSV
ncbi:hypothetical protein [Argonema galeatum]|uniref:hypothetical protein n=1 Tax=Argonema galeatum TaxID=2942762 RepID=UPI0020114853|nr:hypothetical protein [Argonema galeatum]MCL1464428.1 hypothetical protein [Argonema galeatum A003/A1]